MAAARHPRRTRHMAGEPRGQGTGPLARASESTFAALLRVLRTSRAAVERSMVQLRDQVVPFLDNYDARVLTDVEQEGLREARDLHRRLCAYFAPVASGEGSGPRTARQILWRRRMLLLESLAYASRLFAHAEELSASQFSLDAQRGWIRNDVFRLLSAWGVQHRAEDPDEGRARLARAYARESDANLAEAFGIEEWRTLVRTWREDARTRKTRSKWTVIQELWERATGDRTPGDWMREWGKHRRGNRAALPWLFDEDEARAGG